MNRRKFLFGIGVATGTTSLSVGTGAFSASRLSKRNVDISVVNDSEALIGLIPNNRVSGVNLVDGKLTIAMSDGSPVAVNFNSVYQFGAFVEDGSTADSDITGNAFEPIREKKPTERDEDGDFASAFLIANQSNEVKDVRLDFDRDDSQSNGTKFIFEAHCDGEIEDILIFSEEEVDEDLIMVKNLDPGEACGVSFALNALEGEIGDEFGARFSVTAGDPASFSN